MSEQNYRCSGCGQQVPESRMSEHATEHAANGRRGVTFDRMNDLSNPVPEGAPRIDRATYEFDRMNRS